MEITIRLLGSYHQHLPAGHDAQGGFSRHVPSGTTAGELLLALPIPASDVYTVLLNGRHAERDQLLQAGDILAVFPAAGGG